MVQPMLTLGLTGIDILIGVIVLIIWVAGVVGKKGEAVKSAGPTAEQQEVQRRLRELAERRMREMAEAHQRMQQTKAAGGRVRAAGPVRTPVVMEDEPEGVSLEQLATAQRQAERERMQRAAQELIRQRQLRERKQPVARPVPRKISEPQPVQVVSADMREQLARSRAQAAAARRPLDQRVNQRIHKPAVKAAGVPGGAGVRRAVADEVVALVAASPRVRAGQLNRQRLREALVLKEVFDTPLGLRDPMEGPWGN